MLKSHWILTKLNVPEEYLRDWDGNVTYDHDTQETIFKFNNPNYKELRFWLNIDGVPCHKWISNNA